LFLCFSLPATLLSSAPACRRAAQPRAVLPLRLRPAQAGAHLPTLAPVGSGTTSRVPAGDLDSGVQESGGRAVTRRAAPWRRTRAEFVANVTQRAAAALARSPFHAQTWPAPKATTTKRNAVAPRRFSAPTTPRSPNSRARVVGPSGAARGRSPPVRARDWLGRPKALPQRRALPSARRRNHNGE
jgi:hypothetical protein